MAHFKFSCNREEILYYNKYLTDFKKADGEIVITRFNEDLEWTRGIGHLCTVYNKGAPFERGDIDEIHKVYNFGAGLETMLRHIIINYDSLAVMTFFCQGEIADRKDQPIYPIYWYLKEPYAGDFRCVSSLAYDPPDSRYQHRISSPGCVAVGNRDLSLFRKEVVGIEYMPLEEWWVKGDWISVGRDLILSKPRKYYMWLYMNCVFQRGVFVEELWYLERSWHSIFTKYLDGRFKYDITEEDIENLLNLLYLSDSPR